MKKAILLFLVALSATLLFAQPHPIYIEVWGCCPEGEEHIPQGDVTFTAVIIERPGEVIDETFFGWEYSGVIPGYLSGNVANGFSTWAPGETLEITLTQISTGLTITNSWVLTSAGYQQFPNPGGLEMPLTWDCCPPPGPWPFITVDQGTTIDGSNGYGTGLPNEDLLQNPTNVGLWCIVSLPNGAPVDLTVCMDQVALGYVPYNMAYWLYGSWTYLTPLICTNPGTANACITFNIPITRADVPIVFAGGPMPDDGLPVELTNFTAINQQGEFVNVSWTTQSESNMSYYKVYREGQEIFLTEALNQVSEQVYSFVDIPEFDGTYYYTLEAVALDGTSAFWGPTEIIFGADVNEITEITQLGNNYPNPFNPVTTINFSVKENETGILTIYNAKGQVVTNETFTSGVHIYNWNANKYSSGIYFYKLQTGSFSEVKKMLLIK